MRLYQIFHRWYEIRHWLWMSTYIFGQCMMDWEFLEQLFRLFRLKFHYMTRWQTLLEFNLDSDKASWLWPVHLFPDQRQQSSIRFHDILGYTCHKLDYKRRDIANRPLDSLWCSRDFASCRFLRSFWFLLWCPWPEQNRLKFQLISYFTLRKTVSLKKSQKILKW